MNKLGMGEPEREQKSVSIQKAMNSLSASIERLNELRANIKGEPGCVQNEKTKPEAPPSLCDLLAHLPDFLEGCRGKVDDYTSNIREMLF